METASISTLKTNKSMAIFLISRLSIVNPKLNPVEYFNQDIKTNLTGKIRTRKIEELKSVVEASAKQKKEILKK